MDRNKGIVHLIILVIIAIVIISLFGVSLRSVTEEGTLKDNFIFAKYVAIEAWNNYLKVPFIWTWEKLITPFIINPINNYLEKNKKTTILSYFILA
jgi:hypothetical protein